MDWRLLSWAIAAQRRAMFDSIHTKTLSGLRAVLPAKLRNQASRQMRLVRITLARRLLKTSLWLSDIAVRLMPKTASPDKDDVPK
jgi:hypothetical protein